MMSFSKSRSKISLAGVVLLGVLLLVFAVQTSATRLSISKALLNHVESKYGTEAAKRLSKLDALISRNSKMKELEKVKLVNDFFNRIKYYTDIVHWKKQDYWATPVEKLATNGGDCEDYSIAKYFTLRELGVMDKKLRIMYVKALKWGEAHMVLAYYSKPSGSPLVLDNINPKLLPAEKRTDLKPVYSFNGDGLWLSKAKGSGKRAGSSSRISLWADLTKRMDGSDL